MIVFADIETEGLDAKNIWCICTKENDTGITNEFLNVHIDMAERARFVEYAKKVTRWVGHNFINFDGPVINRIVGPVIDMTKIVDTLSIHDC